MSDVDRVVRKVSGDIEDFIKAVTVATFSGVIRDTRVDTGRLRGNWQMTEGAPASGEIARLDPSGNATQAEVKNNVKAFTVMYLTNNLPYARVWENNDGMIARNVARVQRNVAEAARK